MHETTRSSATRLAICVACSVLGVYALLCASFVPLAAAGPGDPEAAAYFAKQWGLEQVNAPEAWQYGTGAGVRIGIVDTGVDAGHPDLAGKVVAAATCLDTDGDPAQCQTSPGSGEDDNGHGTHVAGIAAASGIGVSGVAPSASLVVAKVLSSNGNGSTSDVAAGIEWVVEHGAKVVNLSLGPDAGLLGVQCAVGAVGACGTGAIGSAVEAAWSAGAIPVIAAGNNAGDLFGPQGYGDLDAIVVAATGPDGKFASDYSSTPENAKWGVLAPGGDDPNGASTPACGAFDPTEIVSTYWSNGASCYATDEGTSMATPFVSGTLALLLGRGLGQQQAVQTLVSTLNRSVTCGAGQGCLGLLDAGAAMGAAERMTTGGSAKSSPSPSPAGGASSGRPGPPTVPAAGSAGPAAGSSGHPAAPGVPPTTAAGPGYGRPHGAQVARALSSESERRALGSWSGKRRGGLAIEVLLALAAFAVLAVATLARSRAKSRRKDLVIR